MASYLAGLTTITVDNRLGLLYSERVREGIHRKESQENLSRCVADLDVPGENTELKDLRGGLRTQRMGDGHMLEEA